MAKKELNEFEKRRKGVELVFDLMFWFTLIFTIGEIIGMLAGYSTVSDLLSRVMSVALLFACARLAHLGDITAGILGLVTSITEFLFGGLVFQVLGILLLIDSIMYLINYNKKEEKSEK